MEFRKENNGIYCGSCGINLPLTLDCGQAFRWRPYGDGFRAAVGDKLITVAERAGGLFFSADCDTGLLAAAVTSYFDLDRDYAEIERVISADPYVAEAMNTCRGLRILKQEPFEALISFIISQNNNVPRIKNIVETLCGCFGTPLGDGISSFPSAEKLASLSEEDLAPLRCGYRARYIIEAARKVASGELDLSAAAAADEETCMLALKGVTGVGDKVAACVMLYGLGRLDSFPMDVWMKRVVRVLYDGSIDVRGHFGGYAGVAQQYLFVLARQEKYLDRFGK
ncbi:MAG: DNA-3-methyladenine glycosylase 2 family protein [Clostridia bacterium]|nr:DNA-3-methyladenine glycosylase 2 family protein [Clostridia bacterium]